MVNRHFVIIVAGDNPEELLKPYSPEGNGEKKILFYFKDREQHYKDFLKYFEELANNSNMAESTRQVAKERLEYYKSLSIIEFFTIMSDGYEVDENGNIYTYSNPDPMFTQCKLGNAFSIPLQDFEGNEHYSMIKKDVDWSRIHKNKTYLYEFAWDSVMGDKKPETEDEQKIYDNMKGKEAYFSAYGDKETYVLSNTSFWGYAFLSKETGWVELAEDQFKWVMEFYDRFIVPLPEDTKISVYEAYRP